MSAAAWSSSSVSVMPGVLEGSNVKPVAAMSDMIAQGKALYMSGTHLDINERVEAQEQVRALNASLERQVAERTSHL